MSDPSPISRPIEPVRARWTYTAAEIEHYWNLSSRRTAATSDSYEGHWLMMWIVAGLSIGAWAICVVAGIVKDIGNPAVPLLCAATYYFAHWIEHGFIERHHRRVRAKSGQTIRATTREYSAEISQSGVRYSTDFETTTYLWFGIDQVTFSQDLMLFWLDDSQGIPIPLRAIAEDDKPRALDLAKTRGAPAPPALE